MPARRTASIPSPLQSNIHSINPIELRLTATASPRPALRLSPPQSNQEDELPALTEVVLAVSPLSDSSRRQGQQSNVALIKVTNQMSLGTLKRYVLRCYKEENTSCSLAAAEIQVKVPREPAFKNGLVLKDYDRYKRFWEIVRRRKLDEVEAKLLPVRTAEGEAAAAEDCGEGSNSGDEPGPATKKARMEGNGRGDDRGSPLKEYYDQLCVELSCGDDMCDNMLGRCWIDKGTHIALEHQHIQRWAAALVHGTDATLDHPPRNDLVFKKLREAAINPPAPRPPPQTSQQSSEMALLMAAMTTALTSMVNSQLGHTSWPLPPSPMASIASTAASAVGRPPPNVSITEFFGLFPSLPDRAKEALDKHGVRLTNVLR